MTETRRAFIKNIGGYEAIERVQSISQCEAPPIAFFQWGQ
jgi:hypothetical protein